MRPWWPLIVNRSLRLFRLLCRVRSLNQALNVAGQRARWPISSGLGAHRPGAYGLGDGYEDQDDVNCHHAHNGRRATALIIPFPKGGRR